MEDESLLPEGELTPRVPERADLIALARIIVANEADCSFFVIGSRRMGGRRRRIEAFLP